MSNYQYGTNISDFDAVRLSIAGPDDILDWSHGEVLKPETINYRTQKPERDGLFCEKIFGPVKDINPHDPKYKGLRSREAAIDKNGDIVTKSIVRRERMGHIQLATPVAHIWFLRGTPSAIGLVLNMTIRALERIAYFANFVILTVDSDKRDSMLADKEAEYEAAKLAIDSRYENLNKQADSDLKTLAGQRTAELEELTKDYEVTKAQLDSLVLNNLLNVAEYREMPDDLRALITVGMGGEAIKTMLEAVDLDQLISQLSEEVEQSKGQRKKKLMKRLRMLESMQKAGIKPSSMCISVLPVIPPDMRPMVQLTGGRFATSDLNDLYRRVINRNNRLKKLIELDAPLTIRRNEQRMLQEAVDALIDNSSARSGKAVSTVGQRRKLKSLSDMLKGKQGRFRQNLLGKRVDYSGRSVIVAGPYLKIDECGLPKMMALELFKPFVIGYLIEQTHAHNIRAATRLIEQNEVIVWDALDEVIRGKYVLLNRAPSLHRLSIQAFKPRLIEGKAIQLHPLVCKGFNADFDGDQMAVHLPLSTEAQAEARDLMSASRNLLKPADGSPILHIEQDIVLGAYYMTYDKPVYSKNSVRNFTNIDEAIFAYDQGSIQLQSPIRLKFRGDLINTTIGRVLFNELFPDDFPYQNEAMSKKKLQKVMALVYDTYGQEATARIADDLKDLAFQYATVSGLSMGMDDFVEIKGMDKIISEGEKRAAQVSDQYDQGFITDEERYRLVVNTWQSVNDKVLEALSEQFTEEDTSVTILAVSGARGNVGQVKNAVGMLGVLSDTLGRAIELPVRSNYKKGLSTLELFTATRGARRGMVDASLKTADAGYLTRRLVDVSQDVFTVEDEIEDPGFPIYREDAEDIGVSFGSKLEGRYSAQDVTDNGKTIVKKGDLITKNIANEIENSEVAVVCIMSVLSCPTPRGISRKSYGIDLATGDLVSDHHPVGVIAAQSIGEPGTQLTLRSYHAGGAAVDDITTGLPRVVELFEARAPKGQAFISPIEGDVKVWEEGDHYVVQIDAGNQTVTLPLDGRMPTFGKNSDINIGDVIAQDEDAGRPLVSPITGKATFTKKEIRIVPHNQAIIKYDIPGYKQILVSDGSRVDAGQRLTSGSINLQDLMHYRGIVETQRYIINEISKIFASQGQIIADKHLEIIVRQMFSRVQIEDPGDSTFVTGDIVSKAMVIDNNSELVAAGKEPTQYTQLLLGITKVSTWADSFLSAASFQDTTRVLISAATSGKVDNLYGLKENVILGRKIPVGTGYKIDDDIDDIEILDIEDVDQM